MGRRMALPKIGVNMTEAVVTKWLVKAGDQIREGDAVMEAETDKSVQEIYAAESGVVAELLFQEGETIQCYEDFLVLAGDGEPPEKPAGGSRANPVSAPPVSAQRLPVSTLGDHRIRISPLARKIAAEHGIDPGELSPPEPGNRIVKADVLRFLDTRKTPQTPSDTDAGGDLQKIPMTPVRRTIAARLSESHAQKPCAALTTTVDAGSLLSLREKYKQRGISLSVDAIIAKAAGHVLASHRIINSVLEGETICVKREINVGVAVDTPKGLMVPVLRNADITPLRELHENLSKLAAAAKETGLSASDTAGGTFTVTNLGAFGVEQFTPIINPPECCILAVGAITKEFVPDQNDLPVLQKRFQATLVFDHRIVDGAPAARFLKDLKEHVENPELML